MPDYHFTRLPYDSDRTGVWKEICIHLRRYIPEKDALLELGGGYCDFINNMPNTDKHVVDRFPRLGEFAAGGVVPLVGDATDLSPYPDYRFDTVFSSNLFEHMNRDEFEACVKEILRVLKPGGQLIVIQPNFKYFARGYFDDYTHRLIFTHISMKDWLTALGFTIETVIPKFLPATMKSRLPKCRFLVRLYLRSPIKPAAGQFLLTARKEALP